MSFLKYTSRCQDCLLNKPAVGDNKKTDHPHTMFSLMDVVFVGLWALQDYRMAVFGSSVWAEKD